MFLNVLYTIYWLLPVLGLAFGIYLDLTEIKEKKEKPISNKKNETCYTIGASMLLFFLALFLSIITKIISSFWI